ncbi:uncharacterized protein F4822DRAFT_415704 [Hypoxylon trugodes]|uniref:uncharacterized protein n=1 Tax=Hypoxylon trugodes TaxID=326681 RepID=UPI00219E456C|nr:uncharacterized protein F4822DRAFT_415704 [Hypoxylon trugodes]KAI1384607.1 hypothetical protein F4822DRAFT_415704 [Hypoxylon trugodes]
MSSSTGLSRTRSLRKPTAGSNETTTRDGPSTRSEARNTSPSRLPVKPTMTTRSAAAASSSTTTSRTRTTSSTIGRPLSGVYSKAPSTRTDYSGNAGTRPLGRAASTRQASSSTTTTTGSSKASITRSTTTAGNRPRSSGGPPPTSNNRLMGHTRSRSNVTSLTTATTLRPVSQVSSASSGITSPTTSTISSSSNSKPTTRSQTHARVKSQPPQSTTAPTHHLTSRPAFNTHQQHYSPAKSLAPKPLTSTYLAPPSPSKLPANVAISAETSRLQTELLQLSLLRRDAPAVTSEWHASARSKLEIRFSRLSVDHDSLQAQERRRVEAQNISTLSRWGQASSQNQLGLEEKVQILDEVLNGIWQLGESGGRYQRVVSDFEVWADRMASIITAQRSGNLDVLVDGEEVRFLGELDRSWKRDCTSLQRKLEGWHSALRELGDVDDADADKGSGLVRVLDGCRALVRDMLAELAVMDGIERDAARTEDEWIESMNKAIEDEDDDTPAARAYVPLWKLAA